MLRNFLLLYLLVMISISPVFSQVEEEVNVVGLRFLDYNDNYLPDDLLQTRSAVFVSVPQKSETSSERGDWKSYAREAHSYFRKIGIDPDIYIYSMDRYLSKYIPKCFKAIFKKNNRTSNYSRKGEFKIGNYE